LDLLALLLLQALDFLVNLLLILSLLNLKDHILKYGLELLDSLCVKDGRLDELLVGQGIELLD